MHSAMKYVRLLHADLKRFAAHIIGFFLVVVTQMAADSNKKGRKYMSKSVENHLWRVTRGIEAFVDFSKGILTRYSIWIFHCMIHTLIFSNKLNYMSITLFLVETIIFPIQLTIWYNHKHDVYAALSKTWKWLYTLIIINAIYSYVTLFARFVVIKRIILGTIGLFFKGKFAVFLYTPDETQIDDVFIDFWVQVVMILFAYFTDYCIRKHQELENQNSEELKEKFLSSEKNGQEKMVLMYRHTTIFTTALLIFKGISFIFMGFYATTSPNAYKVLLLLAPLVYFNTLFMKIEASIKEFRMRKMLECYIQYFWGRFASNVRRNLFNANSALKPAPFSKPRDVLHQEAYFLQFLKRMENDVVTLSNKFWPVLFYLWLFYVVIIMTVRVLLELGVSMSDFFVYFGLLNGGSSSYSNNLAILMNEQIRIQVIFGFLIFEFLIIHYYFSLPDNITPMDKNRSKVMIDMMETKIDLYLLYIEESASLLLEKEEEKIKLKTKGIEKEATELKQNYLTNVQAFENMNEEELSKYIKQTGKDKSERQVKNIFQQATSNNDQGNEAALIQRPSFGTQVQSGMDQSMLELVPRDQMETIGRQRASSTFVIDKKKALAGLNISYRDDSPGLRHLGSRKTLTDDIIEQIQESNEEEINLTFYLEEESQIQMKVLFKERNAHTYSIARIINSVSYIVTRFMILPLLFTLSSSSGAATSPTNLLFLIVTITYIFRFKVVSFEDKMRFFMPIFILVIFLENIYLFVTMVRFNIDQKNSTSTVNSKGDQLAKMEKIVSSAFTRSFLIGIACIGFASIIWTAKFVFSHMFVIKVNAKDIFFQYLPDMSKVEIDFNKWKHYSLSWFSWLINGVIIYLNDIYMTTVIIFCLVNPDSRMLLFIMFCLFGYNIFQRFNKEEVTTYVLEEKATNILCLVIKLVVIFLVLFELYSTIISLVIRFLSFTKIGQKFNLEKLYSGGLRYSDFMIIFSLLFFDLLNIAQYSKLKRELSEATEIKVKYSDMCDIQESNENKIYERVLIMMANEKLQNQIDHYLKKGIINSIADLNYHKTDIKIKLRDNRYAFLNMYLEPFKVMMTEIMETVYVTMVRNVNMFQEQDLLYLFTKVCQFDKGIVSSNDLDLEDYLSGNFSTFNQNYEIIKDFYRKLIIKEKDAYDFYKERIAFLEKERERKKAAAINDEYEEFVKEAELQSAEPSTAMLTSMRAGTFGLSRKSGGKNQSMIMDDSPKEDLCTLPSSKKAKRVDWLKSKGAALAEFIITRKLETQMPKFHTIRNSAVFKLEGEKTEVVFHNIQLDPLKISGGYMQYQPSIFFQLVKGMFWTKIENIIAYAIIIILYLNGGLISTLILGILFFRIMIEERGGKVMWWSVVNLLYFLQFSLKFMGQDKDTTTSITSDANIKIWFGIIHFFCGSSDSNSDLQLDAIAQIMILWMIELKSKRLINLPEGKYVTNTGVTIARVVFHSPVHPRPQAHQPLHERDQQRKTEDEVRGRHCQEDHPVAGWPRAVAGPDALPEEPCEESGGDRED